MLKKTLVNISGFIKKVKSKISITYSFLPLILAFLICGTIIVSLSFFFYTNDTKTFYEGILIEGHGMLLDFIVFGLVFTLIDIVRNRKLDIQRFKEEIDDFRHWNEPGASYRIAGIVRRLNKYKVEKLDLSYCNLNDAKLKKLHLQSVILEKANLNGADLGYSNLQDANLQLASLEHADLRIANLERSNLRIANFHGAILRIANLKNANLFNANLQNADLKSADLQNADLTAANLQEADLTSANLQNADMTGAKLQGADLRNAKLKGAILSNANLHGVKLGSNSMFFKDSNTNEKGQTSIDLSQLFEIASLSDAIMPDGTIYNQEWASRIKQSFKKKNK
jgi:uncharacterized protein YjbI with pentapeptide repeats